MADTAVLHGVEECPGELTWSAFGAHYPDTVCANALGWSDGEHPGPVLCDADDEFRARDVPCPFCDPEGFTRHQWGEPEEYTMLWATDEQPVEPGTVLHFHDGPALWWTATHPERGEERVLMRDADGDEDGER